MKREDMMVAFQKERQDHGKRMIKSACPTGIDLPKRLWKRLSFLATGKENVTWGNLDKRGAEELASHLINFKFRARGKQTNKDEFVTAGGISLGNLSTPEMEARNLCPGLYALGEMNDIDGVTGGFNFTSCWSQAFHCGNHIASSLV